MTKPTGRPPGRPRTRPLNWRNPLGRPAHRPRVVDSAKLIELYREGHSQRSLAILFNIHRSTIYYHLRLAGVPRRTEQKYALEVVAS